MSTRINQVTAVVFGILAVAVLPCLRTVAARAQENEIGIYFDADGIQSCRSDGLFQSIDGYLILKGCTEPSGISGWEGRLQADDGIYVTPGELYGQGLNVATFPDLSVRLGTPLLAADNIVLMRFSIFATNPGGVYFGPPARASNPGGTTPILVAGDDTGLLFAAAYRVDPVVGPLAGVGGACGRPIDARKAQRSSAVLIPAAEGDCGESTALPEHFLGREVTGDPWGIAVDPSGAVFVTDPLNDQICRYDSPSAPPTANWDCCIAPHWIAYDSVRDRLYVSGQESAAIQVFTREGVRLLPDIGGPPYSSAPGSFSGHTSAIALDEDGNLYVEENNELDNAFIHRIQVFYPSGTFQRVFATCTQFQPTPVAGQWYNCAAFSIAPDGGLFLLDNGISPNYRFNRIHRFAPSGAPINIWGENGTGSGQLYSPFGVAASADGHVWVTSYDRLIEFTADGAPVLEVADYHGDGYEAVALAPGPLEYLYVGTFGWLTEPERVEVFATPILAHNILGSHWQAPDFQLITADPALLTDCDATNPLMSGVAADGVAPLLLRYEFRDPCTVTWSVSDPDDGVLGDSNGLLKTLDGSQQGQEVTAATETVGGRNIAFVVYTAPLDFDRVEAPADNQRAQRMVRVHLGFTELGGSGTGDLWRDLTISRAPVSFIHGLWGRPVQLGDFKSIIGDPRWKMAGTGAPTWFFADYASSNGDALAANAGVLADDFRAQKVVLRKAGIAAAQLDVVAYSIGGCIARKLAVTDKFRRGDNMGAGDFHKLLTLDTPHWGSPFADLVYEVRDYLHSEFPKARHAAYSILRFLAHRLHCDYDQIIGAAIDDLRPTSAELSVLAPLDVPAHVCTGTGGSDLGDPGLVAAALHDESAWMYLILQRFLGVLALQPFDGQQHDAIVLRSSQLGGMTGSHATTAAGFDGLHTQAPRSQVTGDVALEWALRSAEDSGFFGPLAERTAGKSLSEKTLGDFPEYSGVRVGLTAATMGLPGEEIQVSVEPLDSAEISQAFIGYAGGGQCLVGPDWAGTIVMPSDASGPVTVRCLALLSDGTIAEADPIAIDMDLSNVVLSAIHVEPPNIVLGQPGALQSITVLGLYSDGATRDLSALYQDAAFTYDPMVVAFHPTTSTLQALAAGTTTLSISIRGLNVSVPVTVMAGTAVNNVPHARAGGHFIFCADRELCLDGSASFDYDTALGDELAYAWDIDGDGIFDDASGPNPCVTLSEEKENLIVGLRVSDLAGCQAVDYATLSPEGGFCHDGIGLCSVGTGDAAYAPFTVAGDIEVDGQGRFHVLDQGIDPETWAPRSRIVSFAGNCSFISEYPLPIAVDNVAVETNGTMCFVDCSGVDSYVRRYSIAGQQQAPILLPALPGDPELGDQIAIDNSGNILIGGSIYGNDAHGHWTVVNYCIYTISTLGAVTRVLNARGDLGIDIGEANSIVDFKVGPNGSIFLARQQSVYRADWNAAYSLGLSFGDSDLFASIAELAVGADGSIYTCDPSTDMVRKFSAAGEMLGVRTGGGGGELRFGHPIALCVDSGGRIYVGEQNSQRAQAFRFDPAPVGVQDSPGPASPPAGQDGPVTLEVSGIGVGDGSSAICAFSLPQGPAPVWLRIYDLRGRLTRSLVNDVRPAGHYELRWDGRDEAGAAVASGMYLVTLNASGQTVTRKVLCVR